MSLLLSLLGTAAIAATPIVALTPIDQQNVDGQAEKVGVYTINKKIEAQAKALGGSSEVQKVTEDKISIPWAEMGINSKNYFKIDWANSSFDISLEIYYWDNIWGNAGTTVTKVEGFDGLHRGFNETVKYEDGRGNSGFGRSIDHTWEFIFSDDFVNVNIDTKVWALARDKLAVSYASITFNNLLYNIVLR